MKKVFCISLLNTCRYFYFCLFLLGLVGGSTIYSDNFDNKVLTAQNIKPLISAINQRRFEQFFEFMHPDSKWMVNKVASMARMKPLIEDVNRRLPYRKIGYDISSGKRVLMPEYANDVKHNQKRNSELEKIRKSNHVLHTKSSFASFWRNNINNKKITPIIENVKRCQGKEFKVKELSEDKSLVFSERCGLEFLLKKKNSRWLFVDFVRRIEKK